MNIKTTQLNTLSTLGKNIEKVGLPLLYITLGIIYIWFGGMKFTAGQAEGMSGMIANNPLVSWMYVIFSKQGFVDFLGGLEVLIGVLILGRFVNPALSAIGGLLSVALFTVTLSMMISLPGITTEAGFPALSFFGEFLLKDAGLLAASLFVLGHSLTTWTAAQRQG